MTDRALSGMRILDLTQWESGTSCTQFLGWLGADVIKIESLTGDQSRLSRTEVPGLDGMYFLMFNANKRSMAIDLKNPEGRALFLRTVREADVVVENFAPGTMERLNLDYPVLREENRRIIFARLKGFGLDGPYRDYKSFDMVAQAAGGAMSVTGYPDGEPLRSGVPIADTGSGIHMAAGILAAYIQAQRTGEGQLVEVSMQEVVATFMRANFREHYQTGKPTPRRGNAMQNSVPVDAYRCAPGGPNDYVYIYVQPAIERLWQDFARAIGREDLIADPRCRDAATRYENRDMINAVTRDWTGRHTKWEAMRILGGAGVPCSAVLDTADLLDDPHMNARNAVVTIEHQTRGSYRVPGCPVRLSASPAATTPPPLLSAHTSEVLAELLGMSEAEVAELRARRVVR